MSYTYLVTVDAGDAYVDQRPTAEGYTVYTKGTVDTEVPGNYVITYTFIKLKPAFDTYTENKLVVVNNSTPVITLLGNPNTYINIDSIYADAGATTNLGTLETVFPAGGIDTTRGGSYSIMYVARHKGFTSFATRTVHVVGQSSGVIDQKPVGGLDITEILTKPELGLDISSIEELLATPELGLDISSIEELLAKPELGLDILSIEELLLDDGPIDLSGAVIYPEIAEGFELTDINTWELGTPEKGYSIESIQQDEFGRPEEGYTFISIESSELGLPEEGYGILSLYRYEVAVAPPTEGLDIASIDTLPSAGLDITDIETEPAVGLNITGIGVLPNAGLNITSIETEPAVGLNITGIGVFPNAGLDINSIQPTEYSVDIAENVSLEMNWVEPGTFTMGSPTTEEGRYNSETQHEVTLSNGFYLGKYEVTQAQWEQVMKNNEEGIDVYPSAYDFAANTENFPVERVSWNDVQVFLRRLNEQQAGNIQEGWEFTLPTEAQWEYACRAGTTTPYSWGDTITGDDANWHSDSDYNYNFTQEVGQYASNPWGFFDMHGNVLEWTSDWYAAYGSDAVTDPKGPATGSYRVRRGGSWFSSDGRWLRSAYRGTSTPDTRGDALGFRIVYAQKTVPAFGLDIADIQKSPAAGLDITGIETRPFAGVDITGIGEILTLGSDYDTELSSTINLEMIWVEPGTFTMGSPETEEGRIYYEEHQHEVTLTTGFYLGKYEVTQAQYEAVMTGNEEGLDPAPSAHADSGPNAVYGPGPNRPVEMVSFNDIQVFLARLNEQKAAYLPDGWEYALPTEAEWEYACRAGTTTAYSFGDTITPDDANYKSGETISADDVGQYPPNPWGFYDMHGNVGEWTADAYFTNLSEDATDPYYPGDANSERTIRGGSMLNTDPSKLRSARRNEREPDYKFYHVGFRVALRKIST